MIFDTQEQAEAASNAMFLLINPEGTTERLYGWIMNEDGKFVLSGQDSRFQLVDGKWAFVDEPPVSDEVLTA